MHHKLAARLVSAHGHGEAETEQQPEQTQNRRWHAALGRVLRLFRAGSTARQTRADSISETAMNAITRLRNTIHWLANIQPNI
jgi:hypothetical protein